MTAGVIVAPDQEHWMILFLNSHPWALPAIIAGFVLAIVVGRTGGRRK